MKRHAYLTVFAFALAGLAGAAIASGSAGSFDALMTRIHEAGTTTSQSTYSRLLRKSVNAEAVRYLERMCNRKHPGAGVQTFTLMGTMQLDGVLKKPRPLPDNAFTECVASNMGSVNFPLPPGNQRGWPVAIQFDGTTGKVLYMAGDRQPAMPMYRRTMKRSMPWMYAPVPVIPSHLSKACVISLWVSVGVQGRVSKVDTSDSSCPATVDKAVDAAARQWLYLGAPGSQRIEAMDVWLSFSIAKSGVQVKL